MGFQIAKSIFEDRDGGGTPDDDDDGDGGSMLRKLGEQRYIRSPAWNREHNRVGKK